MILVIFRYAPYFNLVLGKIVVSFHDTAAKMDSAQPFSNIQNTRWQTSLPFMVLITAGAGQV